MYCTWLKCDGGVLRCSRCGREARCRETPPIANCGGEVRRLPTELEDAILSASGPGTELSKLLKRFGIAPTPTCACRAKAAQMDAWGPDECSKPERIEEVVAVMRAEAEARGLPFVDFAAKLLIKRAIHNARKAAQADKME